MPAQKKPTQREHLIDQLLAGQDPSTLFDKGGLLDELKRQLAERALNSEMDHHLAGESAEGKSNSRNGYSSKTVITDSGKFGISVPRDRLSTFDPQLIAKYRRRLPGFDEKIVSMYARGLTVREIREHLDEIYGVDVSPDLISAVTDDVLDEVTEWQKRPLEALYPLVFFDALRVKIRDEGTVRNKAVYVALGVRLDGRKEVLGLWIEQNEGAKFWLKVMNELKNRGIEDILIAVVPLRVCKSKPLPVSGRAQGFPRSHQRHFSRNPGPDLYRPSHQKFSGIYLIQGPQSGRGRTQGRLPGQGCRCRNGGSGRL